MKSGKHSFSYLPLRPGERLDTLFEGRLRLIQHEEGYRFSMDSVLVARFAEPVKRDRIADLGTGCGIIALILALTPDPVEIVGLEVQPELAQLAERNVQLNRQEERVRIQRCDLRCVKKYVPLESFDLAVMNPPFGRPGCGRVNPHWEKARARHEILGSLDDFIRAAALLVRFSGRLVLVYRSADLVYLLRCLDRYGFVPKRMRFVHGRREIPARLVLLSASKGGGEEILVEPPLIMYQADGSYSPDLEAMYGI